MLIALKENSDHLSRGIDLYKKLFNIKSNCIINMVSQKF